MTEKDILLRYEESKKNILRSTPIPVNESVMAKQKRISELLGDFEKWIVDPLPGENLVASGLNDLSSRIKVLVDPMAKTHQPNAAFLFLHPLNVVLHVVARLADVLEHLNHFLVGAAVERAPKRRDTG